MTERQDQRSGEQSINLQAGNDVLVVIGGGVTYEDARQIAESVFRENYVAMRDEAVKVAAIRASEFLDLLIQAMRLAGTDPAPTVRDPDVQFAVFDAQKAYARSGEKDLARVLVEVLVRRVREPQRDTLQVVLNECLQVAPKLTAHHFDLLTLSWLLGHEPFYEGLNRSDQTDVDLGVMSRSGQRKLAHLKLLEAVETLLLPFMSDLRRVDPCFRHLTYAGCVERKNQSENFDDVLTRNYGVTREALSNSKVEQLPSPALEKARVFWNYHASRFALTTVGIAIGITHFSVKRPDLPVPLDLCVQ